MSGPRGGEFLATVIQVPSKVGSVCTDRAGSEGRFVGH